MSMLMDIFLVELLRVIQEFADEFGIADTRFIGDVKAGDVN